MMRGLISLYMPGYARTIVYMLQSTEYQVSAYLAWFWRTTNFRQVAKRRKLDKTSRAKLLLFALRFGMASQFVAGLLVLLYGLWSGSAILIVTGLAVASLYPVVWAHLVVLPLVLAKLLIVGPKERKLTTASSSIFANTKAVKIAVAGSYGKTTMKELLLTVLGAGKKVAATPANKNVAVSHAVFASRLAGDEDVVIVEFGEGQPGDVAAFTATVQPSIGIITGIAPAHLDRYKSMEAAAADIFYLADYLNDEKVFVNGESKEAAPYIKAGYQKYSREGVLSWRVKDIHLNLEGMEFTMTKSGRRMKFTTRLIGRHLLGPLAFCVALADQLGLSENQIIEGVSQTAPYEHRMQPYQLAGGWVIDDTYNGNLEGVSAGLELLKELPAKHKIYVTPGLVDQGKESERVHKRIGELIAKANPDEVVLMKNSVIDWIKYGLKETKYGGKIREEHDPLSFYSSLDQFIATGDVIMMQNDWTDNYA